MKDDIKNNLMGTAYDDTKVQFNVHRRDKKDDKKYGRFLLCSGSKTQLALLKIIPHRHNRRHSLLIPRILLCDYPFPHVTQWPMPRNTKSM